MSLTPNAICPPPPQYHFNLLPSTFFERKGKTIVIRSPQTHDDDFNISFENDVHARNFESSIVPKLRKLKEIESRNGATSAVRRIKKGISISQLLDFPYIKFDTDLVHELSGTTWNMPSALLDTHKGLQVSKLISTVKASPLPAASIEALLRYLCYSPPTSDDTRVLCLTYAHLIRLYSHLELGDEVLLAHFWQRVIVKTPGKTLLLGLIEIWSDVHLSDWTVHHHVVHACGLRIRDDITDTDFLEITSKHLNPHNYLLFNFLSCHTNLNNFSSHYDLSTYRLAAPKLNPLEEPNESILRVQSPNDFEFRYESDDGSAPIIIIGSLIHMIPQWNWIRRMFVCGSSEALSRSAVLPVWMKPSVLITILNRIYGKKDTMFEDDALVILEHAAELDLVDGETGLEPFKSLIKRAKILKAVVSAKEASALMADTQTPEKTIEPFEKGIAALEAPSTA